MFEKQIIARNKGSSFLLFTSQYIATETQVSTQGDIKSLNHVTEEYYHAVRIGIFSNREGDQNHLPYLTSVHGDRYLLSVPGQPPACFQCRASATLDIKLHMVTNLDCKSKLQQSRALLLINGERGMLVSLKTRSLRAPPTTRGTPVVPSRSGSNTNRPSPRHTGGPRHWDVPMDVEGSLRVDEEGFLQVRH